LFCSLFQADGYGKSVVDLVADPGWEVPASAYRQGMRGDGHRHDPRDAIDPAAPLLKAEGLERSFGKGATAVRALRGVDLEVGAGELVAIMGPSGSGKSTLLHILGALDRPDGGTVAISGRRYDDLGDRDLTELRGEVFGFVFQFFNLLPTLTAAENVLLPALVNGERPGRYAARIDELLELVGLGERAAHLPTELSGGEQQRVAIARALLRDPRLVLADEPTGNLDSTSGAIVMSLLRKVVDGGQTVVMVTHDPRAASLADRVVFLRDGTIAGEVAGGDSDRVIDAFREIERGAWRAPVSS
jgi:putative ABC transport system ATP-binding protein